MRSDICWINAELCGRLAIMPRPRAGDWLADEIAAWRREGIDIVVSLLEPDEIHELDLQHEATLCHDQGIMFVSFPIQDRGVPASHGEAIALFRDLLARNGEGKSIAVHCRAGIGRSALIAAGILVLSGLSSAAAFAAISEARGLKVPDTDEQRAWLDRAFVGR